MATYSFTFTAGSFFSFIVGYSNGADVIGNLGSIDDDPFDPPDKIVQFTYQSGAQTAFLVQGPTNWTGISASDVTLKVNDVDYSSFSVFSASPGALQILWSGSTGPQFVDGLQYFVEITIDVEPPGSVLNIGGTSTANFTSPAPPVASILEADGTSAANIIGAAYASASLSSAGTAAVAFEGWSQEFVDLSTGGQATVAFTGASKVPASVSISGNAASSFTGEYDAPATFTVSGSSAASFIPNIIAAETDWIFPSQARTIDRGGVPWLLPDKIKVQDDVGAAPTTTSSNSTHYLIGDTFNIVLPDNAMSIKGIQARIRAGGATVASDLTEINIGLSDSTLGTPKGPQSVPGGDFTNYIFGTSTDLWGLTPTIADIESSTFQLRSYASVSFPLGVLAIDAYSVKIHYYAATVTYEADLSGSGEASVAWGGAAVHYGALSTSGSSAPLFTGFSTWDTELSADGSASVSINLDIVKDTALSASGQAGWSFLSQADKNASLGAVGSAVASYTSEADHEVAPTFTGEARVLFISHGSPFSMAGSAEVHFHPFFIPAHSSTFIIG